MESKEHICLYYIIDTPLVKALIRSLSNYVKKKKCNKRKRKKTSYHIHLFIDK